jgi:tripartite ATP-independent transporter DctM subunit
MAIGTVFTIVLACFFLMLVAEVPIGYCLGISGAIGIALNRGPDVASAAIGGSSFDSVASYALTIVPMYILVGMFALHGRLAEQVYAIADRLLGRVRGGLGIATVAACAGFAAVTGSSVATAATVGRLAVGEMRQRGYPARIATGIVAAAGTLGILIPPSIILAIYGILTGESIEFLLTAGIVPGVLSAAVYGAYVFVRNPQGKERQTQDMPSTGLSRAGTPLRRLPWRGLVRIVILFALVMGGVFTGWFTITESGAMGAFFALLMMLWELKKAGGRKVLRALASALEETSSTTSMSFFLLIGSSIFTFYLVSAGIPSAFTRAVVGLDVPPKVIVLLLLLAMIPLGMALDSLSITVIVVPLAYPVIHAMGFNGVWFGILFVTLIELGQITPPVGINTFIVSGVSGVSVEEVFRGITPFAFLGVGITSILFVFPDVVLWFPNLVLGGS